MLAGNTHCCNESTSREITVHYLACKFIVNCLIHHVLKLYYYECVQDNGPFEDDEEVHE